MRKLSFLVAILMLCCFVFSKEANAAVANQDCGVSGLSGVLGQTELSADKSEIILCALKTPNISQSATCANAGGCKWKSMTQSENTGIADCPAQTVTIKYRPYAMAAGKHGEYHNVMMDQNVLAGGPPLGQLVLVGGVQCFNGSWVVR